MSDTTELREQIESARSDGLPYLADAMQAELDALEAKIATLTEERDAARTALDAARVALHDARNESGTSFEIMNPVMAEAIEVISTNEARLVLRSLDWEFYVYNNDKMCRASFRLRDDGDCFIDMGFNGEVYQRSTDTSYKQLQAAKRLMPIIFDDPMGWADYNPS